MCSGPEVALLSCLWSVWTVARFQISGGRVNLADKDKGRSEKGHTMSRQMNWRRAQAWRPAPWQRRRRTVAREARREDCALVAWYRSFYTPRAGGRGV